MKKIFLLLITIFYCGHTFSQVTYYKGEWTKINSEANFSGLLKLEIKDSVVTGEIIWIYKAIDSADDNLVKYYKGQKGKMGIEHVKGIYSVATNDIQVEGFAKTDPDVIIGMDKYLLKYSLDKQSIYGRTLADGENNGLVYFHKVNTLAAEKEFKALKSNILLKLGDKAFR